MWPKKKLVEFYFDTKLIVKTKWQYQCHFPARKNSEEKYNIETQVHFDGYVNPVNFIL